MPTYQVSAVDILDFVDSADFCTTNSSFPLRDSEQIFEYLISGAVAVDDAAGWDRRWF
jgi:hypothetical protein